MLMRASPLLGSGREIELDGGSGGGKHDSGSSPMRGFLDPSTHPGRYRIGGALLKPSSPKLEILRY